MIYITDEQKAQLAIDHAQAQRKAAKDAFLARRYGANDAAKPNSQPAAQAGNATTDADAWAAKQAIRAEWLARRGQ